MTKTLKEDMLIYDANFKKFHQWLVAKFPPRSNRERAYVQQKDNFYMDVVYIFEYGSFKTKETVATIKRYPLFDENFDPALFYSDEPCFEQAA